MKLADDFMHKVTYYSPYAPVGFISTVSFISPERNAVIAFGCEWKMKKVGDFFVV